jgi:tetratricopeptide (TPR) repeat protein
MRRVLMILLSLVAAGGVFASGSSGGSTSGSSTSTSASPTTALDWYNTGYTAANAGKYQDGANAFQKAIALKADYAEAYNMLGFCTRKLGNAKQAITYYEKALTLKPAFPEAREYYGEAYLQVGNLAKAVQQYIALVKAGASGAKNASELLDQISDYVNKNANG